MSDDDGVVFVEPQVVLWWLPACPTIQDQFTCNVFHWLYTNRLFVWFCFHYRHSDNKTVC